MSHFYTFQRRNGKVQAQVVWESSGGGDGYVLPHLMRHSPDGFEYGYGGSGPADLARSIVGDLMNTHDPDPGLYQKLKRDYIAHLHGDGPFWISDYEVKVILGLINEGEEVDPPAWADVPF